MTDAQQPPSYWVAVNMRRFRQKLGWTQTQFGEKLGWTKVTVSVAELSNGRRSRKFGVDEVAQIADALGVTVNDMISPIPPCERCSDEPPEGFTCNTCGRSGA